MKNFMLLMTLGLSVALMSAPSHAVTQRDAYVKVFNKTSYTLDRVSVTHKYSNNYREKKVWRDIRPYAYSKGGRLRAKFNTGFGTTGKDIWYVAWQYKKRQGHHIKCRIKSQNLLPPGWKQHILRTKDANKQVTVTVYNRRIRIQSPSGTSWTKKTCWRL